MNHQHGDMVKEFLVREPEATRSGTAVGLGPDRTS